MHMWQKLLGWVGKRREKLLKQQYILHVSQAAEQAFPYIYVCTWFFLFLDFYLYPGFSRKLILLDPRMLIFLTLGVGLGAIAVRPKLEYSLLFNIVLGVNRLIAPVTIILYFLLTITESTTYPNFIFSHYHLHALFSKNIVLYVITIVLVDLCLQYQSWLRRILFPKIGQAVAIKNYQYHLYLLVLVLAGYTLLQNTFTTWHTILQYYPYMVRHPFASSEAKKEYILGDYAYFRFLRDHTPESAVIAIPPQQMPWLTSGNGGYVRYFLYPRKVPNSTLNPPLPPEAEYVMIAKGEWFTDDESLYGWPRATVSAEKIWYFNRDTGRTWESSDTTYDPTKPGSRYMWGLAKIKK